LAQSQTDSEHVFRYLLSLFGRHPEEGLLETVRHGLNQILSRCAEIDPARRTAIELSHRIALRRPPALAGSASARVPQERRHCAGHPWQVDRIALPRYRDACSPIPSFSNADRSKARDLALCPCGPY